jgi:periplasmic nitrate reductase NapD
VSARELHISSLVVHGRPERLAAIDRAIAALPGAEVAIADPSGKMVVTLETETQAAVADALTTITLLDGVLSAALVFHHVEESQ